MYSRAYLDITEALWKRENMKKKKFCRLGKSTSIRAIDLAVQLMAPHLNDAIVILPTPASSRPVAAPHVALLFLLTNKNILVWLNKNNLVMQCFGSAEYWQHPSSSTNTSWKILEIQNTKREKYESEKYVLLCVMSWALALYGGRWALRAISLDFSPHPGEWSAISNLLFVCFILNTSNVIFYHPPCIYHSHLWGPL